MNSIYLVMQSKQISIQVHQEMKSPLTSTSTKQAFQNLLSDVKKTQSLESSIHLTDFVVTTLFGTLVDILHVNHDQSSSSDNLKIWCNVLRYESHLTTSSILAITEHT